MEEEIPPRENCMARRVFTCALFIPNIERGGGGGGGGRTSTMVGSRAFLIPRNLAVCKDYVAPTQHGRVVVLKPRTGH